MHITIHIAQALYETFENWITAQISTAGIFFSHQELLFDWMFLDFTQKWKKVDKFNSKYCEQSVIGV